MDRIILEGAVMDAPDDQPADDTADQLDGTEQLLVASLPPMPVDPAELTEGQE